MVPTWSLAVWSGASSPRCSQFRVAEPSLRLVISAPSTEKTSPLESMASLAAMPSMTMPPA
jgi:hypothetical protein